MACGQGRKRNGREKPRGQGKGGGGKGSPSEPLSSRMPLGKLLTVRTFRETPGTPESLLTLFSSPYAHRRKRRLHNPAGTARNSHSSSSIFSRIVSHSRTVFFRSSSCSRAITSSRPRKKDGKSADQDKKDEKERRNTEKDQLYC